MYLQVSIAGSGAVADAAVPILRSSVEALRQLAGDSGVTLRVDFDVSGEPERPPSAGMPPPVVPAETESLSEADTQLVAPAEEAP